MAINLRANIPSSDHLWIYDIDLKAAQNLTSKVSGNVRIASHVSELAKETVREERESVHLLARIMTLTRLSILARMSSSHVYQIQTLQNECSI
jgi:hypothetical protein